MTTQGPSGSGRYWRIAVARKDTGGGFCDEASTVGFRSLNGTKAVKELLPLRWVADLDSDGLDELILWGSFPLDPESNLGQYGLTATVYKATAKGFVRDARLTRGKLEKLVGIYQSAAKEGNPKVRRALAKRLSAQAK